MSHSSIRHIHKRHFHLWFGDCPVMTDALPVSQELKAELEHLIEWHDEALHWADPAGDLLWSDSQIQEFMVAAKKAYLAL